MPTKVFLVNKQNEHVVSGEIPSSKEPPETLLWKDYAYIFRYTERGIGHFYHVYEQSITFALVKVDKEVKL